MANTNRRGERMFGDDAERGISIDEVAARMAVSPKVVRELIRNGHIKSYTGVDGRSVYIRKSRLPEIFDKLEDVGLAELLHSKSSELTRLTCARAV